MTDTQRRALAELLRACAKTRDAQARNCESFVSEEHTALLEEATKLRSFADAMDVRVCDFREKEKSDEEMLAEIDVMDATWDARMKETRAKMDDLLRRLREKRL